jgi:Polyketide cyclase / dehydrase and lipid transport
MASITREIVIDAPPADVWAAVRDFGAVHRLAPGFVTDCRLDGEGARIVTFFTGAVAREILVGIDEDARRLVYSVVDSPLALTHDNSSEQVIATSDGRARFVWIKDVLPDSTADRIEELMERGLAAVKEAFEARMAATPPAS